MPELLVLWGWLIQQGGAEKPPSGTRRVPRGPSGRPRRLTNMEELWETPRENPITEWKQIPIAPIVAVLDTRRRQESRPGIHQVLLGKTAESLPGTFCQATLAGWPEQDRTVGVPITAPDCLRLSLGVAIVLEGQRIEWAEAHPKTQGLHRKITFLRPPGPFTPFPGGKRRSKRNSTAAQLVQLSVHVAAINLTMDLGTGEVSVHYGRPTGTPTTILVGRHPDQTQRLEATAQGQPQHGMVTWAGSQAYGTFIWKGSMKQGCHEVLLEPKWAMGLSGTKPEGGKSSNSTWTILLADQEEKSPTEATRWKRITLIKWKCVCGHKIWSTNIPTVSIFPSSSMKTPRNMVGPHLEQECDNTQAAGRQYWGKPHWTDHTPFGGPVWGKPASSGPTREPLEMPWQDPQVGSHPGTLQAGQQCQHLLEKAPLHSAGDLSTYVHRCCVATLVARKLDITNSQPPETGFPEPAPPQILIHEEAKITLDCNQATADSDSFQDLIIKHKHAKILGVRHHGEPGPEQVDLYTMPNDPHNRGNQPSVQLSEWGIEPWWCGVIVGFIGAILWEIRRHLPPLLGAKGKESSHGLNHLMEFLGIPATAQLGMMTITRSPPPTRIPSRAALFPSSNPAEHHVIN